MNYTSVVEATNKIIAQYDVRLTIRQIYYRLISPPFQLFANILSNYKGMDKILTRAREVGDINWRKIEDRSRATIGGDHGFDNPDAFLSWLKQTVKDYWENYTREMWKNQENYVEVWVEKDALATLVSTVANGLRVLTLPSRGYSSFTKVMEAVEDRFDKVPEDKKIYVIHLADHDPSGIDMTRDLEKRIAKYADSSDRVEIDRAALTFSQVKKFGLASNPTKSADPRAMSYVTQYGNECWELDALPPDELEKIIRIRLNQYIDDDTWDETRDLIEKEKADLKKKFEGMKLSFAGEKPKKRKK